MRSSHSAPPAPRASLAAFAVCVFFIALAGDAFRYSVSWYGYAAVVLVAIGIAVRVLVANRTHLRIENLPIPVASFLLLATVSILWSYYPGATALGAVATIATSVVAVAVAVCLTWDEILRTLSLAVRAILALSLLFEFVVAAFIRSPVLPIWPNGVDYGSYEKIPLLFYWSRELLFDGGKIQGIVGNSSLLGFVAILGLVLTALQLAGRSVSRTTGVVWMGVAAACLVLTRSATIWLALVACVVVVGAVLLVRNTSGRRRLSAYGGLSAALLAGVVALLASRDSVLALLGKSSDLTGRTDVWAAVIDLASQRPVLGWGWVSYWVPWVAPFDTLATEAGVRQLHAHNAWLDVWLQLGWVGIVIVVGLVLSTTIRAWLHATDVPYGGAAASATDPRSLTLLPLLLMTLLVVQSLAESRLLVEYGWLLLLIVSVKTKMGDDRILSGRKAL